MKLFLKKLHIKKHPLLKTKESISFSEGINLFVGKNGSGKSRFLELVRACVALNFDDLNEELELSFTVKSESTSVDISYEQSFEEKNINGLGIFKDQKLIIKYSLRFPEGQKISFEREGKSKYNGFSDAKDLKLFGRLWFTNSPSLSSDFSIGVSRLTQEQNRISSSSVIFREGLEYSKLFFAPKISFLNFIDNKWIAINKFQHCYSPEIIERIYGKSVEVAEKSVIELSSENDALLLGLKEKLAYKNISIKTQAPTKELIEGGERSIQKLEWAFNYDGFTIEIDENRTIKYNDLSYGEKRYILLAFYLKASSFYLLDEPINGLHHSMIKDIMIKLVESRNQTFIANQSPILFDYIEFDEKKDVINKIVICEKDSTSNKLVFSDPDEKLVNDFYKDYKNDFLQVHEILKNHGLW